jgi:hypothetical protein
MGNSPSVTIKVTWNYTDRDRRIMTELRALLHEYKCSFSVADKSRIVFTASRKGPWIFTTYAEAKIKAQMVKYHIDNTVTGVGVQTCHVDIN